MEKTTSYIEALVRTGGEQIMSGNSWWGSRQINRLRIKEKETLFYLSIPRRGQKRRGVSWSGNGWTRFQVQVFK